MTIPGHEDDCEWDPVMPFVVCKSQQGPYDDVAFVAGYRAGLLDAALSHKPAEMLNQAVEPALLPLLDLLGMRYGYTLHIEHDGSDDWALAHFRLNGGNESGDDR